MIIDEFVKLVADMRKAQQLCEQNKGNQFFIHQKMKCEEKVDSALLKPIKVPLNNQKTLFQ